MVRSNSHLKTGASKMRRALCWRGAACGGAACGGAGGAGERGVGRGVRGEREDGKEWSPAAHADHSPEDNEHNRSGVNQAEDRARQPLSAANLLAFEVRLSRGVEEMHQDQDGHDDVPR